ncbi:TetR/AcrR family transcriptional regulator [Kineococcus rhizosphaerae]|uniref:TetR family transcriptional regulator n=1 Tax=Kineococcus rhizosphaerae TaxID=559628 RepID=A0A2T0R0G9_9ACTN|nr:TetR/AcrR family transcriptional regulator [Kineococcus rhizosphaerae]PRY12600.1 TetR family transcriptional regulator [Kineococcus rhizosphaerae]
MPRTLLDRSDAVRALAGVFRRRGFDGASLSVIQQETGMGRGSLYHFFPEGKADMARAVLAEVQAWFEEQVFEPLRTAQDADAAVVEMARTVQDYFLSRQRVCLFAVMALGGERETYAEAVRTYFSEWVGLLAGTLQRAGIAEREAADLATDAVATIQGGLVLARALDDDAVVVGTTSRAERRLRAALS